MLYVQDKIVALAIVGLGTQSETTRTVIDQDPV